MTALEYIKSDLFRYHGKISLKSFFYAFFLIEGFRYTFFLRLKNCLRKGNPLYWILFLILRRYSYKYGFQIFSRNIGKGLYIGHFGTIIINGDVRLGHNVNLSPGVIIGKVNRGKKKGVPKIGNNVWIGSNSILVGNINIGNNVLIAPGSYVNKDVPDFSLVSGNPSETFESRGVDGYILNSVT